MSSPHFRRHGAPVLWIVSAMTGLVRALLWCLLLLPLAALHAAPAPAGFQIKNRAEAQYVPDGAVLPEILHSNTVVAQVERVEALTLTADTTVNRSPGARLVLPHLLTNTGNDTAGYALTLLNLGGDDYDLLHLRLVHDLDGDGLVDAGEPDLAADGKSTVLTLAPGRAAHLLVVGVVPPEAGSTGTATARLGLQASAAGSGRSADNTDTVRTGRLAAVVLDKRVDQSGSVYPGMQLHYRLVATNIGNSPAQPASSAGPTGTPILIDGSPATVFLVRDEIPTGTAFVPGSLTTSLSQAIKLYRLPGDAPFSYRTHAGDIAALEVAVASPAFALRPNSTTEMGFTVQVKAGHAGAIDNTGEAFFDDGTGAVLSRSNLVKLAVPVQRIGLAKRAEAPTTEVDSQTGRLLGTARVPLRFVLENFGDQPAHGVQIRDLLEGSSRFGRYTASASTGAGEYTLVAGSWTMRSLKNQAHVAADPAYDGTAAHPELLAAGATLPAHGAVELGFDVRVNVTGRDGLFHNTAEARATLGDPAYAVVRDDSVNGSLPDANGDGDPTNDASPTPILLSLPSIQIEKRADKPRRLEGSGRRYEIDYTLTITNTGKMTDAYVRVADNLECTFRTYESPAPVASWQLVGRPAVEKGLLTINPAYTGSAPCTDPPSSNTDPTLSMPRDTRVLLTDGSRHLAPGAREVIRFTVRIELAPQQGTSETRSFDNIAIASVFDRQDAAGASVVAASQDLASVLLDPSGVVYDSVTRAPVAGAVVTLSRVPGSCSSGLSDAQLTASEVYPISGVSYSEGASGVSMTTGADGRYLFFLSFASTYAGQCEYRLHVAPPAGSDYSWPSSTLQPDAGVAPGGRVQPQDTPPTGSESTLHYLRFNLGPLLSDVLNNHVPLDPLPTSDALMLQKTGNRMRIEIGQSVEYTLRLRNASTASLSGLRIEDRLPAGFRLVAGSARLDGAPVADPAGSAGTALSFDWPARTLGAGQEAVLVYRAVAGVTAVLGPAVNRATAFSGSRRSNEAAWRVQLDGGVFSDEAYLFGKVFLDCNRDGVQGHEEIGIPGVRLLLEDGTGVVTDVEGKYSLYGLRAITHVLKLDATTLPPGSRLGVLDSRNAGRGDSRFVDLKKGELHKADFAVDNCEAREVVAEVQQRRRALATRPDGEGEAVSKVKLVVQQEQRDPTPAEVRSRAATGEVGPTGIKTGGAAAVPPVAPQQPARPQVFEPVLPRGMGEGAPSSLLDSPLAALPRVDLEQLLPEADNRLAFLDLKDGDTLPMAMSNVRVKGRLGATLRLTVNGRVESELRVGKRARVADKQLQAWEYIGIELKPGENVLLLQELDGFGNVRGEQTIRLIAPGRIGRIELDAPKTAVADAATRVPVRVRLTDDKGVPVTARTQLTLETQQGRWEIDDLNPTEPGTQVFIEGGVAEFGIIPPNEPEDGLVRVSSGVLVKELSIAFLPELRPMIGAGILEGVIDLRRKGVVPVGQGSRDAFEQTLRRLSHESDDGRHSASGRLAFYFKGTVRGDHLLTAAFDSDKDTRERLFRDIQPDKFYPIYGDSSAKIFDAQSSQRLFVRIDKDRSYLLYGDFITAGEGDVRRLSQYNRASTGLKYHHESERVSANAFASRDSAQQVVLELPANGTSGPYQIGGSGEFRENSERIEILVRDRSQPGLILQTIPLQRITDYVIEPLSRRVLFTAPVASLDENLNTRHIRISYEAETGGPAFWTGGADMQLKLNENLQLGASVVRDLNPAAPATLAGTTAVLKLADQSVVIGELARSETLQSGTGQAGRLEWNKEAGDLRVRAQLLKADGQFDNPMGGLSKGRTEATVNATLQQGAVSLRSQAVYSSDETTGAERQGVLVGASTQIGENLQGEIGMRASHDTAVSTDPAAPGNVTQDLLTVRGRLGLRIPALNLAQTYLELEQDLRESGKRMAAVGADYQLNEKTRLYGRYEFISSLGSPFALTDQVQNNVAVLGFESAYLKDGRIFNEFRLRDSVNGREGQAASGLRKMWTLAPGLRLGGGIERTGAFGGVAGQDSLAITTALEYTGNERYKLHAGLEGRHADAGDSYLNTLGLSYKLDKDWSALARSVLSLQENNSAGSRTVLSRQQIGFAWRQVDLDRWNALGRYEYQLKRIEGGTAPSEEVTHIVSAHASYQPARALIVSGRHAYKWGSETYGGIDHRFHAHLLYGRLTWDFAKDWDSSLQAAHRWGQGGIGQSALGLELGRQLQTNLWFSVGYNAVGLRDEALAGGDHLDSGVYFRLRFKFDEGLFR